MKLSRFDTSMSPDNRNTNLKETSPDDVKKMFISRVEGRDMASTTKSGVVKQRNKVDAEGQEHGQFVASGLVINSEKTAEDGLGQPCLICAVWQ